MWRSDSVPFRFTFFMFYGSCHYSNKTSVPHLILFSGEFVMLNQLFPQQPCCYKHELKTSVSIRKICCNGEDSFMCICILFRGNGNNFCCVLFFFQVVLLLIFSISYSHQFSTHYSNSMIKWYPRKRIPNVNFFWFA